MLRWDKGSNENCESALVGCNRKGVDCEVGEWVKCGTLIWSEHYNEKEVSVGG